MEMNPSQKCEIHRLFRACMVVVQFLWLEVLSFYHPFNELKFQIILSEIAIITALIESYSVGIVLKEL